MADVPVVAMATTSSQSKEQDQSCTSTDTDAYDVLTTVRFESTDANAVATEDLELVHLMSLTPEDIPTKYDEICYGSHSPPGATTPEPPPSVDYSLIDNSILKTDYTPVCSGLGIPTESVEMTCNLSPIVNKSSLKRAITNNDSVELDATGSLTMTPESADYLNLSTETGEESLSDRCRSFLSDVSRTLFPEHEWSTADIDFEGLGDDDAFECTLHHDESGLFDVTVEELKTEEIVNANECVMPNDSVSEEEVPDGDVKLDITTPTQEASEETQASPEEKPKQNKMSFGDLFQMDITAFGDLFGCTSSSTKEVKSIIAEEQLETESTNVRSSQEISTVKCQPQLEDYVSHSDDAINESGEFETNLSSNGRKQSFTDDIIDQREVEEQQAKVSRVNSLRSRSSSLSLRKQSFGFANTRYSQEISLEVLDEDVEATLPVEF
jgi:hypothetical protein